MLARGVKSVVAVLLPGLVFAQMPMLAWAQDASRRPLTMLLPTAAGSASDAIGRLIGQKLAELNAQGLVAENRPGGFGNVATVALKRAAPDGNTLSVHSVSILINASLYADPGYNALTDVIGVAMGPRTPNLILVHPSVQANNLKELLELAKKQPLAYASSGSGSTTHLSMERLKLATGVDLLHVPHNPVQAITNVLAGHVPIGSTSMPPAIAHVKSGKLRAIAVSTATRSAALPDVSAIGESGIPALAGFDDSTWFGVFAPAGTPFATVERLNRDVNRILSSQDAKERLTPLGLEFSPMSVAEFAAYIRAELPKWARAVKDSGAKVD